MNQDLKILEEKGYRYVFIDEVTLSKCGRVFEEFILYLTYKSYGCNILMIHINFFNSKSYISNI